MCALIHHSFDSHSIRQRKDDGYLNATAMCRAAGKRFALYTANESTKAFLEALSLEVGIPTSKLIQTVRGRGDRVAQGTWVHPKVAIHLAQWLSPEFAVKVSGIVFDWMGGKQSPALPQRSHEARQADRATADFRRPSLRFSDLLYIAANLRRVDDCCQSVKAPFDFKEQWVWLFSASLKLASTEAERMQLIAELQGWDHQQRRKVEAA